HFEEEEQLLFNRIAHPLCIKATDEHRQLTDLLQTIQSNPDASEEIYITFSNLLEKHIRFEERELFPFLEAELPSEMLAEIGEELNLLHSLPVKDNYKDEFWK